MKKIRFHLTGKAYDRGYAIGSKLFAVLGFILVAMLVYDRANG